MTRQKLWKLSSVLLLIFSTACSTIHYSYDGPKKLTTGPGLSEPTRIVRHVKIHQRQFGWIHGGIVHKYADPLQELANSAGDAPGVVNVRLKDRQNITDLLISHGPCLLTILCSTWSTYAEGDVVEYMPKY